MIKKRIKKIGKLVFLITVRQLWKLLCNLYHIIEQPFLALKTLIVKDKDKSQMFLLAVMAVMPAAFYVTARFFWDNYKYGFVSNSVGRVFLIVSILEIIIFGYLGFWIWKIFRKK